MTIREGPRAARQRGHDETNLTAGILADRFPVCKLHGLRVVYRFPDGCPLGVVNPLDRIGQIRGRGWAQLGDRATNDHRGGLTLLEIADVCISCADRLLGHRHAHYLRERAHRHD